MEHRLLFTGSMLNTSLYTRWFWPASIALSLLVPAALAARAEAQTPSALPWFRRGTVMVAGQLGGAAFTDFQRTVARPSADHQLPDFERRVSASTSPSAGGWFGVWLSDRWGLRAGAAYTPSTFSVRNDEQMNAFGRTVPADEQRYAGLNVLMADLSVMHRFPVNLGRVVPYGLAGAGFVRYSRKGDGELPVEAEAFSTGPRTSMAGLLGVGAVIPLQKRDLMLVFELTDHISRTPLRAGSGETVGASGVQLQLDPDGEAGSVGVVNNLRLMVGAVLPIR